MRSGKRINSNSRRARFSHTASQEDYLKSVHLLSKKGVVRNTDIAAHLGLTKASASRGISVLESNGLVMIDAARAIELTDEGRRIANEIHEKYLFCAAMLRWAGLDEETADREACLMEHALSDTSFTALKNAVEKLKRQSAEIGKQ
jgi:Mn-dependent DtxR family transcriptional regulator